MSVDPLNDSPVGADAGSPQCDCWRCGKSIDAGLANCPYCAAVIGSGSAAAAPSRAVSRPDSALMRMLVAYGILLAFSVVAALILRLALDGPRGASATDELTATLVLEGIDTVVVLAAIAYVRPRNQLPRKNPSQKAVAWLVFLPVLAGLLALNTVYHSVLRAVAHIDLAESSVFKDPALLPGWILAICVQPALVEELFFRYLALGALRSITGVHAAVILSAVMFGMMHLFVPLSIPMLIVLGIGLGYARVYSGGLMLPIALHFLHNSAVLVLEKLGPLPWIN